MQSQLPIPHSLTDWLWFLLANFITFSGGVGFWSWLTNRKKSKAETHESVVRSRSLEVQSTVSAGDVVLRYIDRLSNAEATIIDQKVELVECREKADEAEALRAANKLLENQLQESEVQRKYWEGEARKRW